jgi:DNA helicase-2/ATP-dependent DNA helicase PcrA
MGNPIVARLIGGAGTGKTTELLRLMEAALDTLGGDPLKLGFASFTRAARAEAVTRAARAWEVDESLLSVRGWFRTVHSTVYRCLGVASGQLITDKRADVEWLSEVLGVRLGTQMDDETGRQSYIGDPLTAAALNCWAVSRTSLMPLDEVVRRARRADDSVPDYAAIVRIAERYETAKRLHDRLDFTDMLLRFSGIGVSPTDGVYQRTPEGDLPEVSAWLFDEQQDASPLLDAACRRLVSAPTVKWCYVVGDPFQAIYGFAGSSAECFLAWDAAKVRTMPKSYRCPAPILELGEKCLRRMHRGYFDRGIAPADHDGSVHEVGDIDDVTHRIDPNDDWLLIARTNFQANRFFAAMHAQGKPVRWATTTDGPTSRTLGLQALYALEQGEPVTGVQWSRALELLPQKDKDKETVVARGAKTLWKKPETVSQWDVIFPSELEEVGATEMLQAAIASGEWVSLVDRGSEWRRQADKWGAALASEPRVRVGTIHSVKGAEADNVALLTTTSRRVQLSDEDADQHDEECRIAYVAVTRAKRNLWIINEGKPGTPRMEVL